MQDARRLYDYLLVPNALVQVVLWPIFAPIYTMILANDVQGVMTELANSMLEERAWAALYLAAFCGNNGLFND